jgi:hypothetical protein
MRTGHLSEISQERYLWVSRFDKGPAANWRRWQAKLWVMLQRYDDVWRNGGKCLTYPQVLLRIQVSC